MELFISTKKTYIHESSWQKMAMVAKNKITNVAQKIDMTKENCATNKKFEKSLRTKRCFTKTTKNKGFFKL